MVGEGQEGAPGTGELAVPPQAQAKATQLWDSFSPAHGRGLRSQVVRARGQPTGGNLLFLSMFQIFSLCPWIILK